MGAAATFVLLGSNIVISLLGKIIPAKVRIPCFIVVIASFVTIVELVMGAYLPELSKSLGIFIPLIVVNCVILGRAEAFASKHGLWLSILDGIGMGLGFTFAIVLIGAIREVLGDGKLFGYMVFGPNFQPVLIMILAPGAFITIGLLMGWFNLIDESSKKKAEAAAKAASSNARGGR
jgi:electron transport complex protein RnfE